MPEKHFAAAKTGFQRHEWKTIRDDEEQRGGEGESGRALQGIRLVTEERRDAARADRFFALLQCRHLQKRVTVGTGELGDGMERMQEEWLTYVARPGNCALLPPRVACSPNGGRNFCLHPRTFSRPR